MGNSFKNLVSLFSELSAILGWSNHIEENYLVSWKKNFSKYYNIILSLNFSLKIVVIKSINFFENTTFIGELSLFLEENIFENFSDFSNTIYLFFAENGRDKKW